MNRILLTVLVVSNLATPAFSQDPDSLRIRETQEGFVPLWDTATVQGTGDSDTLARYQRVPRVQADSLVVVEPDFSHSSSRAIMLALVLPGLGQAYNKKYYKIPIVWAALGVAGYAISYNTGKYREYSKEYALVPDETNERYLRFWRRNLELSYIGLIAVYALQVLDAYVDAQLYSWDVNENLSLRIEPTLQPLMVPTSRTGQLYGLTCRFDLKRR